WSWSPRPAGSGRPTSPSTALPRRCANSIPWRWGWSRPWRTSTRASVPGGEAAPKDERRQRREQNLVTPASDRVDRAEGGREKGHPEDPRDLHASSQHLRIAPDRT